jgi:hypothetical protein
MPPIFPQMHGDPIGTGLLGQQGRFHRIWHLGAARLPHRRHMIDINA